MFYGQEDIARDYTSNSKGYINDTDLLSSRDLYTEDSIKTMIIGEFLLLDDDPEMFFGYSQLSERGLVASEKTFFLCF